MREETFFGEASDRAIQMKRDVDLMLGQVLLLRQTGETEAIPARFAAYRTLFDEHLNHLAMLFAIAPPVLAAPPDDRFEERKEEGDTDGDSPVLSPRLPPNTPRVGVDAKPVPPDEETNEVAI